MPKQRMRSFIVEMQVETAEVEVQARTPEEALRKAHNQVLKAGILSTPGADGTRILEELDSTKITNAAFQGGRFRRKTRRRVT